MSLRRAILSRVSSSSISFLGESRSWARSERSEVEEIEGGGRDGVLAAAGEGEEEEEAGRWARMLPELIAEIVRRVEAGGERWPLRKDVVSCACVCRRWREVTRGAVRPPLETGKITFPSSLKEVTLFTVEDFVPLFLVETRSRRRHKKTSIFWLAYYRAYGQLEILITFW
ncbi:hypothetical protein GW17_00060617 [Ensete ventricosum]|uniref:Uncharacterized protein n=1 Tax=Ensete ventricosum TaxID=4639 RepID=A0A444BXV4_ENSVE|nr:hypothetical protein GW17_00060617 [Ensete ventricosum]RZR74210.1 hypothetical protein BHM03_00033883 [Ensete ventricosum]